ncbi:Tat pathway signal protein [Brevundimonas sp. Leaf363]|uniref:glycoside hydrolase family 125 protein n=1 Tax=Brevundimonas sp. Leaf363 TaxID=1736353 RepID=UPI0006FE350E|nr:glycoside hydrolase family 125 protein [Brevundimonas sp. Leaf363]KQS55649.1 Tat pathway signal protein [Brevundimonas sp. Leaf363]
MPIDRRQLLGAAVLASTATSTRAQEALSGEPSAVNPLANGRPGPAARHFRSPAVDQTIAQVERRLGRRGDRGKLARMFANCFPNTLDTTVELGEREGRPDAFVITGDIPAMWLRDSSAQVQPYVSLAPQDATLRRLLAGVIHRQSASIVLDPYANAFNKGPTGSPFASDETEMKLGVWERKWEIDSLCYPVRLAHAYWKATGDVTPFDAVWREAAKATLRTFREQQRKDGRGPYSNKRTTGWSPDMVPGQGWGHPIRPVGLICSLFRPSDDAATFLFLVPSNMFAVVSLRQMAEMHEAIAGDAAFAAECRALADEVDAALKAHAIVDHPVHGAVWAYEVDGYGGRVMMDDANAPNLISAPYFGYGSTSDPVYRRTRAMLLSDDNPWFHKGTAGEGIGSPHTPGRRVWPIAVTMRALTSTDDAEILTCLRTLIATDAGTGFMHEAFDIDDPTQFSRPWFAWANTLFGELVLTLFRTKPGLLEQV